MLRKLLASIAVLLASLVTAAPAMASTDCTGTISYITEYGIGTGTPSVYVALSTNIGFFMLDSDPSYKGVFALASLAKALGSTVIVTFAANGVTCSPGSFSWRSDLAAFHQ